MTKAIITLTDAAAEYIRAAVAKGQAENHNYTALRVSVAKGGCSGSEYHFEYVEKGQDYDEEVSDKGVQIFIDPRATLKMIGSTLDYEDTMFKSGLVFINPNESGKCGCGKSVKL